MGKKRKTLLLCGDIANWISVRIFPGTTQWGEYVFCRSNHAFYALSSSSNSLWQSKFFSWAFWVTKTSEICNMKLEIHAFVMISSAVLCGGSWWCIGLKDFWGSTELHCQKFKSTKGSKTQTEPRSEANILNQANGRYGFPFSLGVVENYCNLSFRKFIPKHSSIGLAQGEE